MQQGQNDIEINMEERKEKFYADLREHLEKHIDTPTWDYVPELVFDVVTKLADISRLNTNMTTGLPSKLLDLFDIGNIVSDLDMNPSIFNVVVNKLIELGYLKEFHCGNVFEEMRFLIDIPIHTPNRLDNIPHPLGGVLEPSFLELCYPYSPIHRNVLVTARDAMNFLKEEFKRSPDYAHDWHCNIACAVRDAIQSSGKFIHHPHIDELDTIVNDAASRFMMNAFGVETSNDMLSNVDVVDDGDEIMDGFPKEDDVEPPSAEVSRDDFIQGIIHGIKREVGDLPGITDKFARIGAALGEIFPGQYPELAAGRTLDHQAQQHFVDSFMKSDNSGLTFKHCDATTKALANRFNIPYPDDVIGRIGSDDNSHLGTEISHNEFFNMAKDLHDLPFGHEKDTRDPLVATEEKRLRFVGILTSINKRLISIMNVHELSDGDKYSLIIDILHIIHPDYAVHVSDCYPREEDGRISQFVQEFYSGKFHISQYVFPYTVTTITKAAEKLGLTVRGFRLDKELPETM